MPGSQGQGAPSPAERVTSRWLPRGAAPAGPGRTYALARSGRPAPSARAARSPSPPCSGLWPATGRAAHAASSLNRARAGPPASVRTPGTVTRPLSTAPGATSITTSRTRPPASSLSSAATSCSEVRLKSSYQNSSARGPRRVFQANDLVHPFADGDRGVRLCYWHRQDDTGRAAHLKRTCGRLDAGRGHETVVNEQHGPLGRSQPPVAWGGNELADSPTRSERALLQHRVRPHPFAVLPGRRGR